MKEYRLSGEAMVMIAGSSAGTQPKFFDHGFWYKTNQNGYESTAEYLVSSMLQFSNVAAYVKYEICRVNGRTGTRSRGFLSDTETFISFQRLYDMFHGGNLSERILPMNSVQERIQFVKDFILSCSGVDCGRYLSDTLSLDMLTLNTDRHFHNLGIIIDRETGKGRPAPIFDNGDALLSNFGKFPPALSLEENIDSAYAQPFSADFYAQAAVAGITLKIDCKKLLSFLQGEPESRAKKVLQLQLERYRTLFDVN